MKSEIDLGIITAIRSKAMANINYLPDELIMHILIQIPTPLLYGPQLKLVCKKWYKLMKTNTYKRLAYVRFYFHEAILKELAPNLNWHCEFFYTRVAPAIVSKYATKFTRVIVLPDPDIRLTNLIITNSSLDPSNLEIDVNQVVPAIKFFDLHKTRRVEKSVTELIFNRLFLLMQKFCSTFKNVSGINFKTSMYLDAKDVTSTKLAQIFFLPCLDCLEVKASRIGVKYSVNFTFRFIKLVSNPPTLKIYKDKKLVPIAPKIELARLNPEKNFNQFTETLREYIFGLSE